MYIPFVTNEKRINENQVNSIISLDPGIRTFLTGYSPNGHVIEIGKSDINRIIRLCLLIDKLQSIVDFKTTKCKKRLRVLKKISKIRRKIRNLKDDFHYKVCKYLCDNYNVILLPKFNISNIVLKSKRKINSKSVRQLLNWNHCEFR